MALQLLAAAQEAPLTEAGELEMLLAERLWPALRIGGATLEALRPFLYFQGYCRTGVLLFSSRVGCIIAISHGLSTRWVFGREVDACLSSSKFG